MDFGAAMFFTDYSMPGGARPGAGARGFESAWAPEHSHIPSTRKTPPASGGELEKRYYDVMDPFVTLTAAAIATKTLKVGTGVCLVIQRDTIQTAKLVATIDHVSGGRFLFGVGGGWNQDEIEDHGTVFNRPHNFVGTDEVGQHPEAALDRLATTRIPTASSQAPQIWCALGCKGPRRKLSTAC